MAEEAQVPDTAPASEAPAEAEGAPSVTGEQSEATADSGSPSDEPVAAVQYWRWKGMARKKNRDHGKTRGKPQKHAKGAPVKRKAEPVLATGGGAFA